MALPNTPVKRWNFHKAKWSHYIAKTLLPPDSLDVDAAYQASVTPLRKQPKRLSHAGIEISIFRVGMQSVNPSVKLSCSLLSGTTQVWLLQLCLPSLTESRGNNAPKQFEALTSHTLVEGMEYFEQSYW